MKFDLHVHSRHSNDSGSKVIDIIHRAMQKGLTGIAITDHHSFEGSREAMEINPYPSFLVIPGTEYATEFGHVQGLFINGELKLDESLRGDKGLWPLEEVVQEIHRQGGIAVLAHPFKNRSQLPSDIWDKVDAIEVYNGRAVYGIRNRGANEQAANTALKYGLPFTAGSDGHWLDEIGNAYLELHLDKPLEKITLEEVKEAILQKRGRYYGMGSPPYYQSFSQLVKIYRTGAYSRIPRVIAKMIVASAFFIIRKR